MTEQKYNCPSCHKDYTQFTISDHYECGVEPLESQGRPSDLLVRINRLVGGMSVNLDEKLPPEDDGKKLCPLTEKPESKKRGRKPKAK